MATVSRSPALAEVSAWLDRLRATRELASLRELLRGLVGNRNSPAIVTSACHGWLVRTAGMSPEDARRLAWPIVRRLLPGLRADKVGQRWRAEHDRRCSGRIDEFCTGDPLPLVLPRAVADGVNHRHRTLRHTP